MKRFEKEERIFVKRLLFALSITMACLSINAQKSEWKPSNREIVVRNSDSIIRAQIRIEHIKIPTDPQLNYFWFRKGAIHSNQGGYSGLLLDGNYQVFNINDQLITQGEYEQGLRTGEWKYWTAEGYLRFVVNYRKGLMHGLYILYDRGGEIVKETEYSGGNPKIKKEEPELITEQPDEFSKAGKEQERKTLFRTREVKDTNP